MMARARWLDSRAVLFVGAGLFESVRSRDRSRGLKIISRGLASRGLASRGTDHAGSHMRLMILEVRGCPRASLLAISGCATAISNLALIRCDLILLLKERYAYAQKLRRLVERCEVFSSVGVEMPGQRVFCNYKHYFSDPPHLYP
jgi:hypothetical protein